MFELQNLERTVLRTAPILDAIRKNDVVTLQADWSHAAPEVTRLLSALIGEPHVPVLAIFPAGDPNHPILVEGLDPAFRTDQSQQIVLDALAKAGTVEVSGPLPSSSRFPPFSLCFRRLLTQIGYKCTLSQEARNMQRPSENPSISVEMLRQRIAGSKGPNVTPAIRRSLAAVRQWTTCSPKGISPRHARRVARRRRRDGGDAVGGAGRPRGVSAGGTLVVVERQRQFYPPAAVWLGIAPRRLLLVHADERADHDWALNQALRCPAVAAVLAWPETLGGRLDDRTFRRLQLAAEESGSLGLFIRPASVRHEPSWADVRWLVEPRPADLAAKPAAADVGVVGALSRRSGRSRRGIGVRR